MRYVREIKLVLVCCSLFFSLNVNARNKDKEMDHFVNNLLEQMTLEEKIGQMNQLAMSFDITGPKLSENVEEKIRKGAVGAVLGVCTAKPIYELQQLAMQSRLKIPLIFGFDVIHGHRTIFPINLGLAASWDMDLIERTAKVAADEASADGLNWTFSPMVDITRDPRWGRVSEGSGEDPYLGSEIAKAMIRGYEQDDLSRKNTLLSCVKHFALYGASEAGRDYNTVDMSPIRMYNEYFLPYKAGIEAGSGSVMTSFNDINGIPATANRWLLTDVLRKQWGFEGFVVSDYTATTEMVAHGMGDEAKVAELAINAGVDMEMVGESFYNNAKKLLEEERISNETIDAAVRRILEAKYRLGLFEDPFRYIVSEEERAKRILTQENKAVALEAAQKSIVLLKNDAQLLPLSDKQHILYVGPLIKRDRDLIGSWSSMGDWKDCITIWQALEKRFDTGGKNYASPLQYAEGCSLISGGKLFDKLNSFGTGLQIATQSDEELNAEAIRMAKKADVIVVALGEPFSMTGEAASRSDISLPGNQRKLLEELKKTGKPIVLVLMNGRPLTLTWEDENMDAILETWYGGTRTGEAIVDVLFGDINPSGKLTMTFPRNVGQIPVYYNCKTTGRPLNPQEQKFTSQYLDVRNEPLYPFGYGLSYTTFAYRNLQMSSETMSAGQTLDVSVQITNTGNLAGEEIVQFYLRDVVGSITRPVKELKGFRKIFLEAGETREVPFTVTTEMLRFYNSDLEFVAEEGEFEVFAGGNSSDCLVGKFSLKTTTGRLSDYLGVNGQLLSSSQATTTR